jgi:DNA-binding response OmpR family regulator
VTAYHDDNARVRALNEGVVCYLRKPIDEKHLMRCLRTALHSDEPTNDDL